MALYCRPFRVCMLTKKPSPFLFCPKGTHIFSRFTRMLSDIIYNVHRVRRQSVQPVLNYITNSGLSKETIAIASRLKKIKKIKKTLDTLTAIYRIYTQFEKSQENSLTTLIQMGLTVATVRICDVQYKDFSVSPYSAGTVEYAVECMHEHAL